jgi:serine/threonine protein kinase
MDLRIPGLEDVVEVGRGGFATVYRAYQPAFRRTVAVKVLNARDLDERSAERFRRECQAMGLLSEHPSIVTILDAGDRRLVSRLTGARTRVARYVGESRIETEMASRRAVDVASMVSSLWSRAEWCRRNWSPWI